MIWSSKKAEEVTGGYSTCEWQGNELIIDSRLVKPGNIFLALKGENSNGHNYINQALENGAAVCIVSEIPDNVDKKAPLLVVQDVFEALNQLAEYKRKNSKAKFIAVTGSVGKTSTKEALNIAFSACGKTFASRGNYNNFMGVPVNLASMPDDTEFAIFEIGMNHAKEIIPLTNMVKPNLAIITNVEPVHLEFFNSIENISEAKAEIFFGLSDESIAIINKDNNQYKLLKKLAIERGAKKIIEMGKGGDYEIINCHFNDSGCLISAKLGNQTITYQSGMHGVHQAKNTLTALAAVKELAGTVDKSAAAMRNFTEIRGRGKHIVVKHNNKKYILIDDSYNASPAAVKESLKVLGRAPGRKIAILADMRELGPTEIDLHRGLKQHILENDIDLVIACGHLIKYLYEDLPDEKKLAHFSDVSEMYEYVENMIKHGDTVLIKGSLGTKIKLLVEHLLKEVNHAL